MTNRAEQVRAWLAAQDGPRTSGQIADALGYPASCHDENGEKSDRMRLHWTVCEMCKKGLLVRVGSKSTGYLYAIGRPPQQPMSEQERAERRRERERRRYAAIRQGLTWEQWVVIRTERANARKAARQEEAARKREARAKELAERQAKQAALARSRAIVQQMKAQQRATERQPRKPVDEPPARKDPPAPKPVPLLETSDQAIARGVKVERIAPGVWSTPLKHFPVEKAA